MPLASSSSASALTVIFMGTWNEGDASPHEGEILPFVFSVAEAPKLLVPGVGSRRRCKALSGGQGACPFKSLPSLLWGEGMRAGVTWAADWVESEIAASAEKASSPGGSAASGLNIVGHSRGAIEACLLAHAMRARGYKRDQLPVRLFLLDAVAGPERDWAKKGTEGDWFTLADNVVEAIAIYVEHESFEAFDAVLFRKSCPKVQVLVEDVVPGQHSLLTHLDRYDGGVVGLSVLARLLAALRRWGTRFRAPRSNRTERALWRRTGRGGRLSARSFAKLYERMRRMWPEFVAHAGDSSGGVAQRQGEGAPCQRRFVAPWEKTEKRRRVRQIQNMRSAPAWKAFYQTNRPPAAAKEEEDEEGSSSSDVCCSCKPIAVNRHHARMVVGAETARGGGGRKGTRR